MPCGWDIMELKVEQSISEGNNPPLLRRPRPPKQVLLRPLSPGSENTRTVRFREEEDASSKKQRHYWSFPLHDDLYRHSASDRKLDLTAAFTIHPKHPKGPEFFQPGENLACRR